MWKTTPSGTTLFVYDAFGQLAAEYSTTAVTNLCTTCYLSTDHLGSTRLVTDQNGNVVARHDYAPFGQEIPAGVNGRTSVWGASDFVNQKFTGYERDAETALDFSQARYMPAGLGRFMSPDPANGGADFTNPQSWNGYAYVLGNPLGMVDPSGLDGYGAGDGNTCEDDPLGCDPGFGPFPPGGFPASAPAPPPRQTEGTGGNPLPPGSFPGGETLGLPPGLSVPGPFAVGSPNPFIFSVCPASDQACGTAALAWPLPLADILVAIYEGANGFGHAGVGVNSKSTYGLYPATKPPCLVRGCSVGGVVKVDHGKPLATVVIKTTAAQDGVAQQVINYEIKHPPAYNLYGPNCGSFVEFVLTAAGVKNVPRQSFRGDWEARLDASHDGVEACRLRWAYRRCHVSALLLYHLAFHASVPEVVVSPHGN